MEEKPEVFRDGESIRILHSKLRENVGISIFKWIPGDGNGTEKGLDRALYYKNGDYESVERPYYYANYTRYVDKRFLKEGDWLVYVNADFMFSLPFNILTRLFNIPKEIIIEENKLIEGKNE